MGIKKAAVLLAAVAAALLVASRVAWAATIQCPNRPDNGCEGTMRADTITGTPQPDQVRARGGDDVVNARAGDGDFSKGGSGEDRVRGQAGQDQVIGGSISGDFETGDLFFADGQDDVVRGGDGDDTLYPAQRHFPFRGDVRINKEMVDCDPGEDTAYIDRGVDEVKDNCETVINGFPDMGAGASSRESQASGPFGPGSE